MRIIKETNNINDLRFSVSLSSLHKSYNSNALTNQNKVKIKNIDVFTYYLNMIVQIM